MAVRRDDSLDLQDLNLLQAFPMVSLSRDPTSAFIFWNRSSI